MLSPDIFKYFFGKQVTAFTKYQCKTLTDNLDEKILHKMKEFITNNYTEVAEIE